MPLPKAGLDQWDKGDKYSRCGFRYSRVHLVDCPRPLRVLQQIHASGKSIANAGTETQGKPQVSPRRICNDLSARSQSAADNAPESL